MRSRFDTSQCSQAWPEPCVSRVTRTVWDGDQLLLELRATGDENLDNHTEWVAYTQGPGIDAPLMVRAKHGGSTHDIIPLANWRGLFEAGVFPDGRTAVDGLDLKTISWPAAGYTAYFDYIPDGDDKEPVWLGSLMSHKRDASGQLYMRNRYYDPQSGRFTQEDPIGLAGGLNLYGFGGGDPVNYSDPFGLAACPDPKNPDCEKGGGTLTISYGVTAAFLPFGFTAQGGFAINREGSMSLFGTAGYAMGGGVSFGPQVSIQEGSINDVVASVDESHTFTFSGAGGAASGSVQMTGEGNRVRVTGIGVGARGPLGVFESHNLGGISTTPVNIVSSLREGLDQAKAGWEQFKRNFVSSRLRF